MPNINLRLTDEQHELLVASAADNGRSLQKELIWRLFRVTQRVEVNQLGMVVDADAQSRDVAARTITQDVVERVKKPGGCLMQVPRGTKCKSCGKVH